MSDDNVREFLQHLAQDQELQRRISSEATDRAAAVALTTRLATEAGFEVDAPSMERDLGELAAAASEGVGEELSDDQLEAVAGGLEWADSTNRFSSLRPVFGLFSGVSTRGTWGHVNPGTPEE